MVVKGPYGTPEGPLIFSEFSLIFTFSTLRGEVCIRSVTRKVGIPQPCSAVSPAVALEWSAVTAGQPGSDLQCQSNAAMACTAVTAYKTIPDLLCQSPAVVACPAATAGQHCTSGYCATGPRQG